MLPNPHVVRRGAGTPVLFIHGNGVDHRLLSDLDDVFASDDGDGWERIYVDLPGFGQTPQLIGRGGLPDVADWLDELTSELIGSSSFAVVANSLGGLLARDLVARRPAGGADGLGDRLGRVRGAAIGQRHIDAVGGQQPGDVRADAARGGETPQPCADGRRQ